MSISKDNQSDLFVSSGPSHDKKWVPLAERVRPRDFSEFVGQENILGEGQPLRKAIEADHFPSLILWGPPGSGKTTLAGVIAQKTKAAFVSFSAVLSGIPELRTIIKAAQQRSTVSEQRTIFIGLSMGGYILMAFSRKYPEKVKAVVFADTRAHADTEEGQAGRFEMAQNAYKDGPEAIADLMLPKL